MYPAEELMGEVKKCSDCGFCLGACPVYRALGIETLGSRGRMDTIRGLLLGDLELTSRMEEILSCCLLCMACQFSCPSGVTAHRVILGARHRSVSHKGLPVFKRWAFRKLLKDRRALGRALRMGSALQRFGPGSREGSLRHLPTILSGMAGGRALPRLGSRPLRERVPERTPASAGGSRGRVGLFTGCYLEFVDTPIGEAGIRVLASQGFDVLVPRGQACCGAPALYSGDLEGAIELALINARAFAQQDAAAVVTLCATCGSAIREGYRTVASHLQGEDQERVMALSERVQDVTQLLAQNTPLLGLSREMPMTLTYHDPCHHVRALGVREGPRELVQAIPGIRLAEMAEPAQCCGGGGSFSLTHPEVSLQVGLWKVQDILTTGARAVVTACPGCILQIQEVALREKAPVEVLHVVEILDRALA